MTETEKCPLQGGREEPPSEQTALLYVGHCSVACGTMTLGSAAPGRDGAKDIRPASSLLIFLLPLIHT